MERNKSQIIHRLGNGTQPKDGYWISNAWLTSTFFPQFLLASLSSHTVALYPLIVEWKRKNNDDLSNNINADIACEHGNLQFKDSGRKIIPVEVREYHMENALL